MVNKNFFKKLFLKGQVFWWFKVYNSFIREGILL